MAGCHWWSKRRPSGIWDRWTRRSVRPRDQDSDRGRRVRMVSFCGGRLPLPTLFSRAHWRMTQADPHDPGLERESPVSLLGQSVCHDDTVLMPGEASYPRWCSEKMSEPPETHPQTLTVSMEHGSQWPGCVCTVRRNENNLLHSSRWDSRVNVISAKSRLARLKHLLKTEANYTLLSFLFHLLSF